MISCAAIQRLERYGSLGLKRHSTEDFVSTSLKDARRANVYALTLLSTWKEAVQAVRGGSADGAADASKEPARYTDALVYAVSFAVALTTQHLFEVGTATVAATEVSTNDGMPLKASGKGVKAKRASMESAGVSGGSSSGDYATAASLIFQGTYAPALELLTLLKEMAVAIGGGRALRSNASSDDFTKAVAHLLTSSTDLALLLLSGISTGSNTFSLETEESQPDSSSSEQQQQWEAILGQALVLVAATAQMLRRVQASFPIEDLYHTRPCAALLKSVANKHRQLQQRLRHAGDSSDDTTEQTRRAAPDAHRGAADAEAVHQVTAAGAPALLSLLRRYVHLCARRSTSGSQQPSAACLFAIFSLFQRLGLLHGALGAVTALQRGPAAQLCSACEDVQYWLAQLLSSTACNRATRYVVYFREDELRLMQHNVRQASEYALLTFATTPPVDPGLVGPLLQGDTEAGGRVANGSDEVTHARAALVLAQWCVSAPFFFESFCRDESWTSFAQEQRRLVLLQQSRARRGLERTSRRQQRKERAKQKGLHLEADHGSRSSSASCDSSDAASVHSSASDTASCASARQQRQRREGSGGDEMASRFSFPAPSRKNPHGGGSVAGSLTSLSSRVSLLSTLSKHSAASYLSFISVLRPSIAADPTAGGAGACGSADGDDEDAAAGADRQMHESEDGNTNLPLILLEQLTLGLHRFMEAYPTALLDRYGLRSLSWSSIARLFAFVETSLANNTTMPDGAAAAVRRQRCRCYNAQEPPQRLFDFAQDIRYNKGMGYECLGVLFAKVVAPLLDLTPSRAIESTSFSPPQPHQPCSSPIEIRGPDDGDESSDVGSGFGAGSDGDRTEEGFFANPAAAAATVGRAVLTINDDPATRASVEAALSTCLTAYETVAPQVVDMNLPTILRLAARTAAASAGMATSTRSSASLASLSSALVDFVRHITARLGRSNDLPHLVDALLGRRDFAANASAAATSAVADCNSDTVSTIRSLRAVFSLAPVRQAVMEAAGASLDPESLLLRLISVAAELEEGINRRRSSSSGNPQNEEQGERLPTAMPRWKHDDAEVQRMLLALELMEALLAGVAPTSVSASAVLEQTTQLELLLNASFMAAVEELKSVSSAPVALDGDGSEADKVGGDILHDRRLLLIQHMYTIRQCRAVTVLCLQDLGTQHVHDYLHTLEDALWQLTSHVGNLIGSLTFAELQPLLQSHPERCSASEVVAPSSSVSGPLQLQPQLLLPSLVLQRLSLARAVSVALGIRAGPAEELRDMAAHLWDCLGHDRLGADATTQKQQSLQSTGVSLWLANQMTAEEWASVVALSTEKHARASMMALLLRSASFSSAETTETPAWLSRCLECIPGTVLRALVDAFLSLSVEDLYDASLADTSSSSARRRRESAHRQWRVLTASLMTAYAVVGHNPYWPSVLAHTVRSVAHVARAWRKGAKGMRGSLEKASPQASGECAATLVFAPLTQQLISLLLYTLRSEARAAEVLRRVLLALAKESAAAPAAPVLSRSGMSVAYLKAIRVPATSLGDLSAPVAQTTPSPNEELSKGEEREVVAALKDLTFEEELRDVCMKLFAPAFVKRIFTLVALCSDNTSAATALPSPTPDAAISACMSTLALLYQICVAAAQASWRAKATNGDVKALVQTPAVVFLHTVAAAFHARGAGAVFSNGAPYDAAASAVMTAFLENFDGHREVHAERRLFVYIASAATAGQKRPRTRDTTESGTGDTANDASASSPRAATVASSSALDGVEELWRAQLRFSARAVMHLSHAAEDERSSSADALPKACIAFRQLFTCMWVSANRKQHPISKRGRGVGGGGRTVGGDADPNHSRSKGDSKPTTHHSSLAGGVDACLAALFCRAHTTGDGGSNAVGGAAGDDLRSQLAHFFGTTATATDGAACRDERSYGEHDQIWARLLCVGGEAGAGALWLLWKLQCVSVTLTYSCAADKDLQDDSQTRMRKFLDAYYDLNASDEGKTETAATTSTYARAVTALRASAEVFRVLPAEAAPPLFHKFVYALLARTIPGASPRSREAASSFVVAAPAVAELLVHLFSIRPRLPAGEMLPRAQYLLVWLSHAYSSAGPLAASKVRWIAAPSLPSLCIRVCAAVAAHPAVVRAADSSALMGARHSGRQLGDGSSAAQELLDTVWLLLFSLLRDSRTPLLHEGEMVQLILLLTKTWLGRSARQQVLWSRPAILPPLLCALFTCVMRGMDSGQYSPRLLNVLASGLAAMAAHVDAATANEGDDDVGSFDGDGDGDGHENVDGGKAEESASRVSAAAGGAHRGKQARRLVAGAQARAESPAVPAHVKRAALAAATSALFEVAHHHMHVFTTFSSDTDFLFTDFLKVLSQHFLPTVTRPPIAHHVGVRIGGTVRSEMTFADLVYTCVGSVESKSLLKQAAWRMEDEEGLMDGGSGSGDTANDAERGPMRTGGSRCIFRVA
ncbi:hypothetical protein GH5_07547 [Leishmania sp. Ghana 2012 LV757]|uniref:hypothetical protein n=1 Tax=Leishmania sp. Ghana 2012 LV757 TaxID=2803181 RepID=UPI001B46C6AA|nr:hypothetical protein GH5_07547 [Leishmania sp. Ghana 2012 LV757]